MIKTTTLTYELKISKIVNVLCDQKRIEHFFSNLIKNSMDFVPKDFGIINLKAEIKKDNAFVQFSAEVMALVFQ